MQKISQQHSRVFAGITANTARQFLREVLEMMDVGAVQVDGGSEFMAEFEAECKAMGIGLIVLPPASPTLNGIVEWANRTVCEEFWAHYTGELTCKAINKALAGYLHYYNSERSHSSLGLKTPAEMSIMLARAA